MMKRCSKVFTERGVLFLGFSRYNFLFHWHRSFLIRSVYVLCCVKFTRRTSSEISIPVVCKLFSIAFFARVYEFPAAVHAVEISEVILRSILAALYSVPDFFWRWMCFLQRWIQWRCSAAAIVACNSSCLVSWKGTRTTEIKGIGLGVGSSHLIAIRSDCSSQAFARRP